MKEISISSLLDSMSDTGNYADDIWKTCLDEKRKRYKRKDINNSLKKLEILGFIKKIKITNTDEYYDKLSYPNPEDYAGFVNNIMFSNESQIKKALKKLESKRVFEDISKDLNSYKLGSRGKIDYEKLLDAFSNLMELASAILLVKETSSNEKLKKSLKVCYNEIKETLDQTNDALLVGRKSNEIILIERRFAGRIPNKGYLKL
ncbi:MAG: hypothetical protein HRU07_07885 [Nitrosopumilus sp.]|nr:hypothetical protein [Nitrosopumilus sp.]NRA06058.1 hypothetical protein [Nitrosopumilus sp.]